MAVIDCDADYFAPTSYALRESERLIADSREAVKRPFPLGDIYGDGSGGVRAEWKCGDRHVRLVVPADKSGKFYLYHRDGDESGVIFDVPGAVLAEYLDRMISITPRAGRVLSDA